MLGGRTWFKTLIQLCKCLKQVIIKCIIFVKLQSDFILSNGHFEYICMSNIMRTDINIQNHY